MFSIEFSEPQWLLNFYHVIGPVSLFFNVLGIYLLVFETKEFGDFRCYLLLFQVICTTVDFCFTTLIKFNPLYPINALASMGYLSAWFNVSTHFCTVACSALQYLETECLALCFLKKHQKIAEVINIHVLPSYFVTLVGLAFLIPLIYIEMVFQSLYVSQEEQLAYINKNYHDYFAGFSSVPHFVIYVNSPLLYSGYAVAVTSMLMLFLALIFLNADLIRFMVSLKPQTSPQNYEKHKEAIKCLVVQMFTAGLCALPITGVAVLLGFQLDHSQLIAQFLFVKWNCHSTLNMISLFIFFPPYQRFLARTFRRNRRTDFRFVSSSGPI